MNPILKINLKKYLSFFPYIVGAGFIYRVIFASDHIKTLANLDQIIYWSLRKDISLFAQLLFVPAGIMTLQIICLNIKSLTAYHERIWSLGNKTINLFLGTALFTTCSLYLLWLLHLYFYNSVPTIHTLQVTQGDLYDIVTSFTTVLETAAHFPHYILVFVPFIFWLTLQKLTKKNVEKEPHCSTSIKKTLIQTCLTLIVIGFVYKGTYYPIDRWRLAKVQVHINLEKNNNELVENPWFLAHQLIENAKKIKHETLEVMSSYSLTDEQIQSYEDIVFKNIPKNFEKTSSNSESLNVLLIMLESYSSTWMELMQHANIFPQGLKKHFDEDYFQLETLVGTASSMEGILHLLTGAQFNMQGFYFDTQRKSAPTNISPFINSGFETSFIYAGSAAWHSNKELMTENFKFKNYYSEHDIMSQLKLTDDNFHNWGIHNDVFFDFMFQLMKKKSKSSHNQFIMAFTSDLHKPYRPNPNWPNIPVPTSFLEKKSNKVPKEIPKVLNSYHATYVAIEKFLDKFKQSDMKDDFVILITSDHPSRHDPWKWFKKPTPKPYPDYYRINLHQYTAPIYMYIPKKLRTKYTQEKFKESLISHDMIFPTLLDMSLPKGVTFRAFRDSIFSDRRMNVQISRTIALSKGSSFGKETLGTDWTVGEPLYPSEEHGKMAKWLSSYTALQLHQVFKDWGVQPKSKNGE